MSGLLRRKMAPSWPPPFAEMLTGEEVRDRVGWSAHPHRCDMWGTRRESERGRRNPEDVRWDAEDARWDAEDARWNAEDARWDAEVVRWNTEVVR